MTTPQDAAAPGLTVGSGVEAYYRLHARIYDATRWSFLFGRNKLVQLLSRHCSPSRILEIGCGTGSNLDALARTFPSAGIVGVDLSADMLSIAREKNARHGSRVELRQQRYDQPLREGFNLVVASYALSMFNPGWDNAIGCAWQEVSPGGHIAVVDFHSSRLPLFRRWMAMNHVRMEGHILPELNHRFQPLDARICAGICGLWHYQLFIGRALPAPAV